MLIKLTNRLQTIVNLISNKTDIIDIGTDHGYVPIWLFQKGNYKNIYASDLLVKPLQSAIDNAAKYCGEDNNINFFISNGLEYYVTNKIPIKTAIVAGMGANTIIEIISKSKVDELILHPTNREEKLRKYLLTNGYEIVDERIVLEHGIFSIIIKATITNKKINVESNDIYLGPILKNSKDHNFLKYVLLTKNKLEMIVKHRKDESITENIKSIDWYLKRDF